MKTERLILRKPRVGDLDDFYEIVSDAQTLEFEPYQTMTLEEAREELDRRIACGEFVGVEHRSTHRMIGFVYLGERDFNALELGFVFNRREWKQGYATESCAALVEEAFARGIHRVFAECDPDNSNSWRLLERIGFVREGRLRKNVFFWMDEHGPIWKDTLVYARLNHREWER